MIGDMQPVVNAYGELHWQYDPAIERDCCNDARNSSDCRSRRLRCSRSRD